MMGNNGVHPLAGRAGMAAAWKHGAYLLIEKLLCWCVHPRLRAQALRLLGASVGRNVRVYEIRLFNLENGFRNLTIADDVHIGPGCRLDLAGPLQVGARSTLSPGVTILTHADPGASHGSRMARIYPPCVGAVSIGQDCWLGANATVLAGVTIGDLVVVAAGSVVTRDVPTCCIVAGNPAVTKKTLANAESNAGLAGRVNPGA